MTPGLEAKLQSVGLGGDSPLPPAFEYDRWREILTLTSNELMPGNPQAGHQALGEWLTDAYLENFIGRALKPVIKLIGTRRAIGRMRQNFRVANNYSEAEATELSPTHFTLKVNEPGLMAWLYRGIIDRGLRLTTEPKNLRVEIEAQAAEHVVYSIRWDA